VINDNRISATVARLTYVDANFINSCLAPRNSRSATRTAPRR
jgi:hypothetical protein